MSTTIDNKVVEMQFDNRHFEKNVQTSLSTLDKLKQSLNLTGAAKGLESIDQAAKGVNMSGLSGAVESVKMKFSALQVMAVTALSNITNSAVNAGKRLVSAFTIDPIKSGFQEYETQINAVQTILANTESKGTTLNDVNKALDTLNAYADKTIYNFTEMTRNIGTFTAAGTDLDTSVNAIQGIANLAAVSGSTSQQASTAMYQLSQALASGTVKLMDWNSVVNAGMGGQVFQDALKETARVHGIAIDDLIEKEGSFRETLQSGWLTSDILTETLSKFTMATEGLTEAEIEKNREILRGQGYTEEQIEGIFKLGNTATNAATKVKTFTQLMETLKEAAQSGWTQTWEIIVGDFEEAKELWTKVSDIFGGMIGSAAEARNTMLQGWADGGGREIAIEAVSNAFTGLMDVIKVVGEAFREVFPRVTSEQLLNLTKGLRDFTEKLKLSGEMSDKLKRTFKGVFSFLQLMGKAIVAIAKPVLALVGPLLDLLLSITAPLGDFFTTLNKGFNSKSISGALSAVGDALGNLLGFAADGADTLSGMLSKIGEIVGKVASKIGDGIKEVFTWIADNVSAGDIFAGLAGGGIFVLVTKFINIINKIKDAFSGLFGGKGEGLNLKERFGDILDGVHDSLQSFATGLKVGSIVAIAVAIGILSASLKTIAQLDSEDISKSLFAIGTMLAMLTAGFKSVTKSLAKFNSKGVIKAGISLVLMAAAIKILADAMVKMSELSMGEIAKGLVGIGGGIAALAVGLKIIGKTKISLSTSLAMIALAESCKMLADALAKFAEMSWGEIARGLTAMGGALAEMVGVMAIMKKVGGGKSLLGSVSLLIAVQALSDLADGLKKFAEMAWDEIGRGLTAMGGALVELGVTVGLLGKLAGFSGILGAGAILIVTQALEDIADSLITFGMMSWDEIARGLTAMGGALAELGIACGLLGGIAGFSSLFGAGAIFIVTQSLETMANALMTFGFMAWDEIGRGLTAMGGALAEVSLACGLLGGIAGFSAIFGAGAITIVIQGLDELAVALQKFGSMAWDEIARGLVAMGGALTELAVITGVLGTLAPLGALIGSGSLLIAIQGLGDLADALKKFGEMSWDEIGRGLTAMGAALGEVALGGLLNTLSGLGALSIKTIAEPLGVLADSMKKWVGVEIPAGLGLKLGDLAAGVMAFTFDALGAASIAIVAEPLGTLADSVKKWSGVTVPEGLGTQLLALADGVFSFTFGGLGASAIAEVASPLGSLADSVKKWAGVAVPENIGDNLKTLSDGVKSFSWAFMGGFSISTVAGPLGELPDAIKKWNDVKIPEGLKDDLTSLADGIQSFSWAFMGGWSLSAITEPLGELADSVKKWNGVTVPTELGDKLVEFADDVTAFATDIKSVNGVDTEKITLFSSAINKLKNAVNNASTTNVAGVDSFVNAVKKLGNLNVDTNTLSSTASSVAASVRAMVASINSIIKSSKPSITASMKTSLSGMSTEIKSASKTTDKTMTTLLNTLAKTIKSKKSMITAAFKTIISGGPQAIKSKYSSFKSAGVYLGEGLVAGIESMESAAYWAGYALGQAAVQGEKDGQQSKSPSKLAIQAGKWLGQGLVIGIQKMERSVYNAGYDMGDSAVSSLTSAIARIGDVINSDIDTQPTIRPVLDLSNIQAGAGTINSMFGMQPSVGLLSNVNSINSMMNRRQNGVTNTDVVAAIKDLGNKINQRSGDTYSINGITYDDGSNITDAVRTLVRAARVERRT